MKPFKPSQGLLDNMVTNCMTAERSKLWPSCMITSATWSKTSATINNVDKEKVIYNLN